MENEQTRLSQDDPGLFKASIDAISNADKPYLGDYEVVSQLLRLYATQIIETEEEHSQAAIAKVLYELANIFLGNSAKYSTVPGWNREGVIDTFVQKMTGSQDTAPDDRIVVLLASMIGDLSDVIKLADDPAFLDEQISEAVNGIYDHYTLVLLGIDPQGSEPIPEGRKLKADRLTRTQESLLKRWTDYP